MAKKDIKDVLDISKDIPGNLRFGVIVAVSLLWVQVLRSLFFDILSTLNVTSNILVDFLTAVIVTFLAYIALLSYRKIVARIKHLR